VKGISPVISASLLVILAIASAGAFFLYFNRVTGKTLSSAEPNIIYPEKPPQLGSIDCFPGYAKVTLLDLSGEGIAGTVRYIVKSGGKVVTGTRNVNISETGTLYLPVPGDVNDVVSVKIYTPYWSISDSCTVLRDDNLVLWLKFDEGSGTAVEDASGNENDGTIHFDSVTVWDTKGNTQYDTADPEGAGWIKVTNTSYSFTGDMVFENGAVRVVANKITTTTIPYYVWDGSSWIRYNAHYFATQINSVTYTNPGWGAVLTSVSSTEAKAKIQSADNAWFEVVLDAEVPYVKIVVHPNGDTVNWIKDWNYLRNRFVVVSTNDVLDELLDRYFVGTYSGATDNIGSKYFSGSNVAVNFGPYMGMRSQVYGGYDTFLKVVGIDQKDSNSYIDSRYWNGIYLQSPTDGRYWFVGGIPVNSSSDFVYIEAENCSLAGSYNISKVHISSEVLGTGDGSTTTFRFDYAHVEEGSEQVYVDGILQTRDVNYTITYETGEIVFSSPPSSGAQVTCSYTYYDAYPDGGSIYYTPSSTPAKVLSFKPNVTGNYRIFIHAKSLGTNTAQFRAIAGGQGGNWVSNSAPDTYYETLNLGRFYLRPSDTVNIYVKDESNTNPVMLDYILLVRIPSSSESTQVFSYYNSEYANKATSDMWVDGVSGKALYFDGKDDYVEVPDSDTLDVGDQFTLIAWAKPSSSITGWGGIVAKGGRGMGANNYDLVFSATSGFSVGFRNDEGTTFTTPFIGGSLTETFYFLGGSYDGNLLCLYLNKEQKTNTTATGGVGTWYNPPVYIAKHNNPNTVLFNGTIDEVRIYNRALSEQEIEAIYGAYSG